METRSSDDTGLTVMLLDCDLALHDCRDACEKFWWPRTFDEHSEAYVDLEFFDGDTKLPSPNPSSRLELKPFIDCFSNIRQRVNPEGYESKKVRLQAHGEVGPLCLKALRGIEAEHNELANTVALIRSGLVIQYNPSYAREDDPNAVGVFEAIGKYPEKCFTLSEPEAHDEWNFSNTRLQRSLGDEAVDVVRLTHGRVKDNFRDFQTRQKEVVRKTTSEGLDFLDDILGPIFRRRKKGPPPRPEAARRAFRVRPEALWRITEFSEHESNGRELDEGERVAVEVLPVLGQSAAAVEPGDGAFDHPTPGLDDEALHPIGSLDDLGLEIGQDAGQGAVKDRPLIGAVGEQFPEKGKQTEQGRQPRETAVAILNVGGGDDAVQQQALRIDQNRPLLALDQLAGIEAVAVDASPPFSALFTL